MSWYQRMRIFMGIIVVAGVTGAPAAKMFAQVVSIRPASTSVSQGMAAIDSAAKKGRYLFLYFWKDNSEQTRSMYGVFKSAAADLARSADAASINISDPNEKAVVVRFDVSRAPMPLVVAVAPNGAVTKAWPIRFTKEQLREGLVSRGTAQCMKALQNRKLVVLCVQKGDPQYCQTALRGVHDFKADARFTAAAEIVTLDGQDQSEATFMKDLQIDPRTSQPVTVVLAPPGQPIARFTGPVTKDQLVSKVTAANSGCCPGGQCCPGGKCGPQR